MAIIPSLIHLPTGDRSELIRRQASFQSFLGGQEDDLLQESEI